MRPVPIAFLRRIFPRSENKENTSRHGVLYKSLPFYVSVFTYIHEDSPERFHAAWIIFYDIPFQERKKLPEHAIESQRLLRQFTICNYVLLNLFSGPPGFDSGPNPKGSLLACPFIRTTAPVESPEGAVLFCYWHSRRLHSCREESFSFSRFPGCLFGSFTKTAFAPRFLWQGGTVPGK